MVMSVEERRARLRSRTQETVEDGDQQKLGGAGLKVPLDLSKAGGEVVWFNLLAGSVSNMIDIIPFEITQPWYRNMRQYSGKPTNLEIGDWDYKLEISVHKKVGVSQEPVLCLREMFGQKCDICDQMFEEYRKKGQPDFDKNLADSLRPRWRTVYKVYDYRDETYSGFKLWDYSWNDFEQHLKVKAEGSDQGLIIFSDPFEGKVIEIDGRVKKIGKNDYIEAAGIRFLDRTQPWDLDAVTPLPLDQMLVVPTYDQVCQIFYYGNNPVADNPQQDAPEASPPPRRDAPPTRSAPTGTGSGGGQNPCPAGGTLGQDIQKYDECNNVCSEATYNQCQEAYDAAQPDPEPEQVPEQEQAPAPDPAPQRRMPPGAGSTPARTTAGSPSRGTGASTSSPPPRRSAPRR